MRTSLLLIPLFALLTGCTGYRLGSMLPRDVQSAHVNIARNLTEEPNLETDVTTAVLAQLQRDGSLRVTNAASADAELYIDISAFRLEPLAFDADNRARPNEFRMILEGRVELIRRRDGATLVRSATLTGRSTFDFTGDLTSAKRTARPAAAEDLARHLVSAVTEAWTD